MNMSWFVAGIIYVYVIPTFIMGAYLVEQDRYILKTAGSDNDTKKRRIRNVVETLLILIVFTTVLLIPFALGILSQR